MIERYNGINLIRIPKSKIKDTKIIYTIKNGGETLEEMYARLNPKPNIIFNAGFFTFGDAYTLPALKKDNSIVRAKGAINYGFALCGKGNTIHFKNVNDNFVDVASNYEWAIETVQLLPQVKTNALDSNIVNGKHMRTAFAVNNNTLEYQVIVTDSNTKLTCQELSNEIKKYGATNSFLFDGGGSSLCLFNGVRVNNQPEHRKISNAIAIWLHEDTTPAPVPTKQKWEYGILFDDAKQFINWLKNVEVTSKIIGTHVHHTYSPSHKDFKGNNHKALQDGMRNYHMKDRGWSDIGQHITIFPDGKIMTGRDINRMPASATNYNGSDASHPFMFEMIGNFDKGNDKLEGKQLESAIEICRYFGNVIFHRECLINGVSPKTCPGTGIDKTWFMNLVNGTNTQPSPTPSNKIYKVQVGAFTIKENAEKLKKELEAKGYDPIIVEVEK